MLDAPRCLPLDPRDPDRVAVWDGDRELGRFTLRALGDADQARRLAALIGVPGPHGLVCDVALPRAADGAAVFAAIARRALGRLYGAVFFVGTADATATVRALGVDLAIGLGGVPAVLAVLDPGRADALARLRTIEPALRAAA